MISRPKRHSESSSSSHKAKCAPGSSHLPWEFSVPRMLKELELLRMLEVSEGLEESWMLKLPKALRVPEK